MDKKPLNILLVEDNETNQKLVSMLLARDGHTTEVASNGLEAVEAVKSRDFDLIFMDVQMPEMDGIEASQIIRSMQAGVKHTPIVAMTAYALQGDAQKCLDAGMDDYIPKPFDVKRVKQVIEACAQGHYAQGPKEAPEPVSAGQEAETPVLDIDSALPRFSGVNDVGET